MPIDRPARFVQLAGEELTEIEAWMNEAIAKSEPVAFLVAFTDQYPKLCNSLESVAMVEADHPAHLLDRIAEVKRSGLWLEARLLRVYTLWQTNRDGQER